MTKVEWIASCSCELPPDMEFEDVVMIRASALEAKDAEIARLREALEKIASVGTIAPEPWGSLNKCPKLARAALEPKK